MPDAPNPDPSQTHNTPLTPPPSAHTGPTTPAGKSISSTNATTHGGTSQKLFVAGEDPAAFHALHAALLAEHHPATGSAKNLVDDLALAQWFLWRRIRAGNSVEHSLYQSEPDPALWPDAAFRRLALVERYRTTAQRSFQRALSNLDHLTHANRTTAQQTQRQENFETRLAFDRERLALQQQRHELTKSRESARQAEKAGAAYQSACGEHLVPTFSQEIVVREGECGETLTNFTPTNGILRLAIERAPFPPDIIHRHFFFPGGVPQEYWWDEECAAHVTWPNYTIDQDLPVDAWLRTAAEEEHRANGHALSGQFVEDDEEEEEEEQEYEEYESEEEREEEERRPECT